MEIVLLLLATNVLNHRQELFLHEHLKSYSRFFHVGEDIKRRYPITVLVFLTKVSPLKLIILEINLIMRDNTAKIEYC